MIKGSCEQLKMIFQLFSLIVLISRYSTGVDFYDQIHESSVLIPLNQYQYNETLDILNCPFISNSCLDCITTKVSDNNINQGFCQWTQGTNDQPGTCSADESIQPIRDDSIVVTETMNVNPCFQFNTIETIYFPITSKFNIDLNLTGYHESMLSQFPLTINLVNGEMTLPECQVIQVVDVMIFVQCDQVEDGEYRLRLSVYRTSNLSNYEKTEFIAFTSLLKTENKTVDSSTIEPQTSDSSDDKFPTILWIILIFGSVSVIGCLASRKRSRKSSKKESLSGGLSRFAPFVKVKPYSISKLASKSTKPISMKSVKTDFLLSSPIPFLDESKSIQFKSPPPSICLSKYLNPKMESSFLQNDTTQSSPTLSKEKTKVTSNYKNYNYKR